MMYARWHIDAKFGHKPEVIQSLKQWFEEIGTQVGITADQTRFLTVSVGGAESTVISEVEIDDLAELNDIFEQLGEIDAHKEWSRELEPHIVSGSNRWEVHRTV